jgi:glycosyltransferase involved in cell wall biosynthesis
MKVLLITGSYPPMACGVGDYSYNLVNALAALPGIYTSVLTSIGGAVHEAGNEVKVFPVMKNWGMIEILKVVKIIWQVSPDIVHIQYPTQGYKNALLPWLLPMIAFLMGKNVVQTWHEIYGRFHLRLLLKMAAPSGLIVVRLRYREQLGLKLQKLLKNKQFIFIRNASAIPQKKLSGQERREIRASYVKRQKRLIVFFGFIYRQKGAELIFDIADPDLDHIVIAGQFGGEEDYCQSIREQITEYPWAGKATVTGFLSGEDAAQLLAVADAVVLPFRSGGGEWNTSIHSAVLQGTFVLTTSHSPSGLDKKHNVYYADIDNILEMKVALNTYAGRRREYDGEIDKDEWAKIANDHLSVYEAKLRNV